MLFTILAVMAQQSAIRNRPGIITGAFLAGYAIARSVCELFREPDDYLGFIIGNAISMGQILSFPMLIAGVIIAAYALRRPPEGASAG